MTADFFVFTRVSVKESQRQLARTTIQDVLKPTRQEPGCLDIDAFGSTRDPQLFFIHSRWQDEAAFDLHLRLSHTTRFLAAIRKLIDRPMEVTRATGI